MTDLLTRETMLGPFPLPQPDEQMHAEAASRPGEWITFVDPAVAEQAQPPAFAIQGGYRVNEHGRLDGDYRINPAYEPSSDRIGFRFASGLELTLWRVLHGYNPVGPLADALYHGQVLTYAAYKGDCRMQTGTDENHPGASLLWMCTSETFCAWEHSRPTEGRMLLEMLASEEGLMFDINPGTSLSLRVPARELATLAQPSQT